MKIASFFLVLTAALLASATASAAETLKIRAKCTITEIQGQGFSSFVPPVTGDVITLDTNTTEFGALDFDSGSMIPMIERIRLQPATEWTQHMAVYTSDSSSDTGQENHSSLQISKFTGGSVSAVIQEVSRHDYHSAWVFTTALLSCVELR